MPKKKDSILLHLNLLKPQGEPQKIVVKLISWALSIGRYIVIFVEILVLAAFLSRFKLDADIQTAKESIEAQIPFVESLKPDEIIIRQTQLQLATIKNIKAESPNYGVILDKIAAQTPNGVIIRNLAIEKSAGKLNITMSGSAQNNNELTTFILGLKEDQSFSDVNVTNAGLEQNLIQFSVVASVNIAGVKL